MGFIFKIIQFVSIGFNEGNHQRQQYHQHLRFDMYCLKQRLNARQHNICCSPPIQTYLPTQKAFYPGEVQRATALPEIQVEGLQRDILFLFCI